jgi:predicted Fe-S protein YdhL (DUF1289 family)
MRSVEILSRLSPEERRLVEELSENILRRLLDPSAAELPLPLRRLAFKNYLVSAMLLLDVILAEAFNRQCADVYRKLESAEWAKMSPEEREKLAEEIKSLIAMTRVALATATYLPPRLREALKLG